MTSRLGTGKLLSFFYSVQELAKGEGREIVRKRKERNSCTGDKEVYSVWLHAGLFPGNSQYVSKNQLHGTIKWRNTMAFLLSYDLGPSASLNNEHVPAIYRGKKN